MIDIITIQCQTFRFILFEEEKMIINIRDLSRLKKELNDTAIKDTRNLFRLNKKLKEL